MQAHIEDVFQQQYSYITYIINEKKITMKKNFLLFCFSLFALVFTTSAQDVVTTSINGSATSCGSGGPGVTIGQNITVNGTYTAPSAATQIEIKHLAFGPNFEALGGDTPTFQAISGGTFSANHTIGGPAIGTVVNGITVTFNILQVRTLDAVGTPIGPNEFCNVFINVSEPPLTLTSLGGTTINGCGTNPGITFMQGEVINAMGTINPPAGVTVTQLRINYQLFDSGFGFIYADAPTFISNPSSPYSINHTIDPLAVLPNPGDIAIIQIRAFLSDGTEEFCNTRVTLAPAASSVPTLGEWGLMVLILLLITVTLLLEVSPKMATTNGQTIYTGINFKGIPFDKNAFLKTWGITGIFIFALFAIASIFFGYEMTNADPIGSIVASAILAYIFNLLKSK